MTWEKVRRRARFVRAGTAALVAIYRREPNARALAGRFWFTGTRHGLVGLKTWLLETDPPRPYIEAPPSPRRPISYTDWLARLDVLKPENHGEAKRHLAALDLPDLLILFVVTRENLSAIERAVRTCQESLHPGWHAVILAAPDVSSAARDALSDGFATERRVSFVESAQDASAVLQRFDYCLLCAGDVLLDAFAAYMFLEAAIRTGADAVYSDHDRMDETGVRHDPAFKPQFSPEYLARYNYIGDCVLVSRAIGVTSDDLEVLLRGDVLEYDRLIARKLRGRRVEHLPFVLFHIPPERTRHSHDLPEIENTGPTVAIVIPTRDGVRHLKACIDSILEKTSYDLSRVRIIVVDNESREPATLEYLDRLVEHPNVSVVRYPHPFNFAAINNFGASGADAEILLFLNNDIEVRDPAWLSKLVWYAAQPDVGVVGAKLLYPDGTIQHGGCLAGGSRGTVEHLLRTADQACVGARDLTREMSVVTGACLTVRKSVFDRIGGFDPILRITWNDVKFCLECLSAGLRNIYVADPLLMHDESKTRGHDNTREKYVRYFGEADYTRRRFRRFFQDDPSYNPNLSLEEAGLLAEPPRVRRPWTRRTEQRPRILVLSMVYKIGFGVPLVIQQQAKALVERGYEVIIAGPHAENEFSFPGCTRVVLDSAKKAAVCAFQNDVSLVICHTPPFFEIPNLIGPHIPVLSYDYGEPDAEFFAEPTRSYLLEVGYQKQAAAPLTTAWAAISQSVKNETLNKDMAVVGLANSHMQAWSGRLIPQRDTIRRELGWGDAFVVLTVCRIRDNERVYKGIDKIAEVLNKFPYLYPEQAERLAFVLAGAGTADDVKAVERLGFTVFANVSDERLAELYMAADAYMGFSRWEGYNLGISQALAMGLPTAASDIPAHREFPIFTSNSTLAVCEWLSNEIPLGMAGTSERRAIVYDWESRTAQFASLIETLIAQSAAQRPRLGASETAPA